MDDETSRIIAQRFGVEVQRLSREFRTQVASLRESLGQKGHADSTALVFETLKLEANRFGATLDLFLELHLEYIQDGDELASLELEFRFDQMYQGA